MYSVETDGIHQWSKDVCAGDEIGWDFVDMVLDSCRKYDLKKKNYKI